MLFSCLSTFNLNFAYHLFKILFLFVMGFLQMRRRRKERELEVSLRLFSTEVEVLHQNRMQVFFPFIACHPDLSQILMCNLK